MWLLLNGCGTGFSVQLHHVQKLPEFHIQKSSDLTGQVEYIIDDSIEGWANALGVLIASYMPNEEFSEYYGKKVVFDYSLIRDKGAPLSYGIGKAPGAKPLHDALKKCRQVLDRCVDSGNRKLRTIDAYDIVMHSSDAVLSGGVRRSATLAMFSANDDLMLRAKTGNWYYENPQRARSNNSAVLLKDNVSKEDYHSLFECTRQFGEPGVIWCNNTEALFNPCVEIGLYGYDEKGRSGWQACNLTTINGSKLQTKENFALATRVAAIIGTLQAGYTDFAYLGSVSESIIRREALLGVSMTGIMDYPAITLNKDNLRDMAQLVLSVNEEFANKIGINLASRTTCVKPEGTASCLLGTSSGIHPSHSRRYIRRVQSNSNENPIQHFKKSNPQAVGVSAWSANKTDEFITFLIEMPDGVITKQHMGAIQLLETVKLVQENWVEVGKRKDLCVQPWLSHNVSNTINVKDGEWPAVEEFIYSNRHSFAGISLLGDKGDLDFNQAPFSKVLMADELVDKYGSGVMFSSGLIVDALHAFDSLWTACDSLLGIYQLKKPDELETVDDDKIEKYQHDIKIYFLQKDWMRRARQFADRYVGGNIRELTYLLKDVNNNKLWLDLGRVYKDVDYTTMMEDDDNTKLSETVACSSGACETMA
jgi:ribonucleoside-diphosphate reductase alpha chain